MMMMMKTSVALRSNLVHPCRKVLLSFRFKLRRKLIVIRRGRPLRLRRRLRLLSSRCITRSRKITHSIISFFSGLSGYSSAKKMDRVRELSNISNAGGRERERVLLFPIPSPKKGSATETEEVEDACRSFENYLVEMIVEEGRVRDLMDVEELLYCWKNLKCAVFVDLVSRFYGELCKDLFLTETDHECEEVTLRALNS